MVRDGAEALAFMGRMGLRSDEPCPGVLLLDMNLPKVDGP
jgi:CheY-like chemotaxis protein